MLALAFALGVLVGGSALALWAMWPELRPPARYAHEGRRGPLDWWRRR